jgi:hypothetical protein
MATPATGQRCPSPPGGPLSQHSPQENLVEQTFETENENQVALPSEPGPRLHLVDGATIEPEPKRGREQPASALQEYASKDSPQESPPLSPKTHPRDIAANKLSIKPPANGVVASLGSSTVVLPETPPPSPQPQPQPQRREPLNYGGIDGAAEPRSVNGENINGPPDKECCKCWRTYCSGFMEDCSCMDEAY